MKEKELEFNIQELDRRRIARDLHDTSLQNLAHLVHKLELASMYIDKDTVQAKLELASISKSINSIIDEIRDTIFDLRPMQFDDLGLKEAIARLLDKVREGSKMTVIAEIQEIECQNETVKLGIFRIIQECVNNAYKYAECQHLKVLLKNEDESIRILVEDDGKGFDVEKAEKRDRHFGLLIMKERAKAIAGKLKILSVPDKGTKVTVVIPKQKAVQEGKK